MEIRNNGMFSTLIKVAILGLLMTLSSLILAQDSSTEYTELAALEIEQVNINHADAATIARVLDGVGISRAEAIVIFRVEYGDFISTEDLVLVKGVGEITVRNNAAKIIFD